MTFLIIYSSDCKQLHIERFEKLNVFEQYNLNTNNTFEYLDICYNSDTHQSQKNYDVIIYHWSFLSHRINNTYEDWKLITDKVILFNGHKIAIPLDEHIKTSWLWTFIRTHKIKSIYSCGFDKSTILKAYPPDITGLNKYSYILSEYLDDDYLKTLTIPSIRPFKIGYDSDIINIEIIDPRLTQNYNLKDVYNYNAIIDYKVIKHEFNVYDTKLNIEYNNDVNFLLECNINSYIFNSRLLYLFINKTIPILIEDLDYCELLPDIHYIELKQDFSNFQEVLKKLNNTKLCKTILQNNYSEFVLSNKITYANYSEFVLSNL